MLERAPARRLYRSRTNSVFAGVAGGIAEYFNIDPTLVRLLMFFLLLASTGPLAPIVYAIVAAIVPQAPTEPPPA